MTHFITEAERARLKAAKPGSIEMRVYEGIRARAYKSIQIPGYLPEGGSREWWGTAHYKASDAAFIWFMDRDERLGEWIRNVALWQRDLPDSEWVGPWFRDHSRPFRGSLETSSASLALCQILDLCGELFTPEEITSLEDVLRRHGMELCLRYCEGEIEQGRRLHNWFNVILNGYGIAALCLRDEEATRKTIDMLRYAQSLFNKDSYGETLSYMKLAGNELAMLQEAIVRFRPDLANAVKWACLANQMEWEAASYLYTKKWNDTDEMPSLRVVSFGDGDADMGPSSNLLVQISVRCKESNPKMAGLASWIFDTAYRGPSASPNAFNWFRYSSALQIADMAPPLSPEEAGIPLHLQLENGHRLIRDGWREDSTVLAIQAGYKPLNSTGHHHQDLGSFQLIQGKERMVCDGGSCCYRLNAQLFSVSTNQHSTVDFVDMSKRHREFNMIISPFEGVFGQKFDDGWFGQPKEPLAKNILDQVIDGVHVLVIDLARAYSDEITKLRRALIYCLPHVMFIIDQAETSEPLWMRSHFPMNNRDGKLVVSCADPQHYTFSRAAEGVKICECACFTDGERRPSQMQFDWGYCHRHYYTVPNADGQGKEGSMEIYNWVDAEPAKSHLRVCALLSDKKDALDNWTVSEATDCSFSISGSDQREVIRVRVDGDQVFYINGDTETRVL